MSAAEQSPPRRLHLVLRDHRALEAHAQVPPGQPLAAYLASRVRYVHLTDVDWLGTGEHVPRMALKVASILWAFARGGDPALTGAAERAVTRLVDVEVEGGYLLAASLVLTKDQRLSDFLQSAPQFIPLRAAALRPRGKVLGDIVVNQDAMQVVREVADPGGPDATPPGDEAAVDQQSTTGGGHG